MKNISYYGYTKEEYDSCKKFRDISNKRNVKNIATVAGVLEVFFGGASLFVPVANKYNFIYFIFGVVTLIIAFSVRSKRFSINPVFQVYFLMLSAFSFGILVSIPSVKEKSLVFPIAMILLPILFIDQVNRMTFFLLTVSIIFCIFTNKVKVPEVAQMDTYNVLCSMIVSMFVQYFVNKNVVAGFVSQAQNEKLIYAYEKIQAELCVQARTDLMTGLYNRTYFTNEVVHFFEDCNKTNDNGYLVMMDLDHFKHINDTLGHQAGDQVIVRVADVIRNHLKGAEYAARLGGDEYIFVLSERFHEETIKEVIMGILEDVHRIPLKEEIVISSSLGITKVPSNHVIFDEMYRLTDQALYQAKKNGGNQYIFVDVRQS